MTGRYTGSYLDQRSGWRAVAILADIGRASLVERIPNITCAFDLHAAQYRMLHRSIAHLRTALPM
jgi:hypothetical protein